MRLLSIEIKNREAWIDNVKMFAMICVVISHCFHYFTTSSYDNYSIRPFINAFNMYLFAFVSGITSFKPIGRIESLRNFCEYVEKLATRIAVPCVVFYLLSGFASIFSRGVYSKALVWLAVFILYSFFIVLFLAPQECCKEKESKIFVNFFDREGRVFVRRLCKLMLLIFACSPLSDWFFRYLLITLIGMALCHLLCKTIFKMPPPVVSIIIFIPMMYSIPFLGVSELALVFVVGYVIRYYEIVRCKTIYKRSLLWVAAVVSCLFGMTFFYLTYYWKCNALHNTFYESSYINLIKEGEASVFLFRQLCGLFLSLSFVLLTKLFSKKYMAFSYWGARTLAIYGIHCVFIVALNNLLPTFDLSYGPFTLASFLLGIAIVLITCFLINIIQRYYYGRVMFLGTK